MTVLRTPAGRVLPVLLGLLLATGAAGAWWLDGARPVPPDEVVRADAWLRTEAVLDGSSLGSAPAASRAALRADLARQLEALGPAPGERERAAVREQRPSPAASGEPGPSASAVLRVSAAALADDALAAEDPALARVLAAAAASRATSARQLDGPAGPVGAPLCDPGADAAPGASAAPGAETAPGGTAVPGTVLWSALDRTGYLFEALAARSGTAPPGGIPAELLEQGREDVEELLEVPAARQVLGTAPGLPAGAYVLPGDATEHPGRAADTAARDVQESAAHVLGRGDAGARCWAVVALERATGLRAALTGEVEALPGVVREDTTR